MAVSYPEGTTALVTDSEQRSLVKIVDLLGSGAVGGGGMTVVSAPPTDDPGNGPNIAYNPTTGQVWLWSGTAWDLVIS